MVLVEERHHVAAIDATFLQGACQAANPVVPFGPGPGSLEIDHRLAVGLVFGPMGEAVVEKAGISQISHALSVARPASVEVAFRSNVGCAMKALGPLASHSVNLLARQERRTYLEVGDLLGRD